MARARSWPRLRWWFATALVLGVCAWLAAWLPALRFWKGSAATDQVGPRAATSRPATAVAVAPALGAVQLDPAFVDRLLERMPELREDLLAWRFDSAFARATTPQARAFVAAELGKLEAVVVDRVRAGRVLEVVTTLRPALASRRAEVRAALDALAERLRMPSAVFGPDAAGRPTSRASAPRGATPFTRGQAVRLLREQVVVTGRVESVLGERVTVRIAVGDGVAFPELAAADVEPLVAPPEWVREHVGEALSRGDAFTAALWLASLEANGHAAPELQADLERLLR